MTKVLLINCGEENIVSDTNKGAEAVAVATVNILKKLIPEATFTSFLGYSEELARKLSMRVVGMKRSPHLPRFFNEIGWFFITLNCLLWAGLKKCLHINCKWLLGGRRLREYSSADVIIYVGMDYYSEDVGTRVVLSHSRDIWLGVLLGKPVAIWAVSAGPFQSRLSRTAARFVLSRVSLITVRDSLSRDFIIDTGVNPSMVYLTADPAFMLSPAGNEKVDEILSGYGIGSNAGPLICINPSHSFIIPSHEQEQTSRSAYLKLMNLFGSVTASLLPESLFYRLLNLAKKTVLYNAVDDRYADYKTFFTRLVDRLIEDYDATILLIAHDQAMAQLFDDRTITGEIESGTAHTDRVITIEGGYSAEEIKGIIGRCEMFIGARFHAAIAAISQGIPAVCFPYYHKFALIEDFGLGKYICHSYTLEEVMPRVNDAWEKREEIKKELAPLLKKAEEMAAYNGELVKQVIDNASARK